MNATPAMSLLFECIQLCTVGLSQVGVGVHV
jgi:hypothetical protein